MYLNSCDENDMCIELYNEFLTLTNKHNMYGRYFIHSQQQPYPYPPKTNTLLFIHQTHTRLALAAPQCLLSNDAAHKGLVNLKDLRKGIDRRNGENSQPRISANPRGSIPGEKLCLDFFCFF